MIAVTACPGTSTEPCRSAGRTLIAVATVADEISSVIVTTVPTGSIPRFTQYPAGTVKVASAATKVKFAPVATPVPGDLAHLQTGPIRPAMFVKFTSVTPVPIITLTVRPSRSALPSWRSAGFTLTASNRVPTRRCFRNRHDRADGKQRWDRYARSSCQDRIAGPGHHKVEIPAWCYALFRQSCRPSPGPWVQAERSHSRT